MNSDRASQGKFGPGLLVTAAFVGPGTVATASHAGATLGFSLLWALGFSIIATLVLQEMAARLGIITGKGLGEAIRDLLPNGPLAIISIILPIVYALIDDWPSLQHLVFVSFRIFFLLYEENSGS